MTHSSTAFPMRNKAEPDLPTPFFRSYQSDIFSYWLSKQVLASEDDLLRCVAQAKECIEQMNCPLPDENPIIPTLNPDTLPNNDITS